MLIRRIFYESFKNLPCEATSRVSKNFSRRQIKNPFLTKVAECSGDEKRYIQYGHINFDKFALSCRRIISTCRTMLYFILEDAFHPKDCFSYA